MSLVPHACNIRARVAFGRRFTPFLACFALLGLARQKLCLICGQWGVGTCPHRAAAGLSHEPERGSSAARRAPNAPTWRSALQARGSRSQRAPHLAWGLSMSLPGHRIAGCLGKAGLKKHALQTLSRGPLTRQCIASMHPGGQFHVTYAT
jgi:hypothetical protein